MHPAGADHRLPLTHGRAAGPTDRGQVHES
jgi:hypothetical protein